MPGRSREGTLSFIHSCTHSFINIHGKLPGFESESMNQRELVPLSFRSLWFSGGDRCKPSRREELMPGRGGPGGQSRGRTTLALQWTKRGAGMRGGEEGVLPSAFMDGRLRGWASFTSVFSRVVSPHGHPCQLPRACFGWSVEEAKKPISEFI